MANTKTTIPAGAKRPQDHLAAEAAGETSTTSFEYHGQEYTVENDCMDDLEIVEAMEDGRYITLVRHILGDAQYATLKEQLKGEADGGRIRLTAHLEPFITELFSAVNPTV